MLDAETVEEVFPWPVKLIINCNAREFRRAVKNSVGDIVTEHNEKYDTKIEGVYREFDEESGSLEYNEFEIYVGTELVHKGKAPWTNTTEEENEFYRSVVSIIKGIIETWHNQIIEVQNENQAKLEELEYEGYDEMLEAYYRLRRDQKRILYLKRLAYRYPKTKYMREFRLMCNRGSRLYRKLCRRKKHEDF